MQSITVSILLACFARGHTKDLVDKLVDELVDKLFSQKLQVSPLHSRSFGRLPSLRAIPPSAQGSSRPEPFRSHLEGYAAPRVPSLLRSDTALPSEKTLGDGLSRRDALAVSIGGAMSLLPMPALAGEAETGSFPVFYAKNDSDIFMPPASVASETILITGANTGLGLESAKRLAEAGAKLVLTARTQDKADTALAEVKAVAPKADVVSLVLDLASLESIKSFPGRYKAALGDRPLDVLLENAGVMAIPERLTTADGFERQLGVNHLGHFALVAEMFPALQKAANGFRIITVSSEAHRAATEQSLKDALEKNLDPEYTQWGNYGLSKAANILFANELQRRFDAAGIKGSAISLHPGGVDTDLLRYVYLEGYSKVSGKPDYALEGTKGIAPGDERFEGLARVGKFLLKGFDSALVTVEQGANTQVFLASAADSKGDLTKDSGRYFVDMQVSKPMPFTQSRELAAKLWEVSERLTNTKIPIPA